MRMNFDRDFYRPKGENARLERPEVVPGGEIWRYEAKGVPYAAVFGGKRSTPDWHFRFRNDEARERRIAEWIDSQLNHVKAVKKRRKERQAPHGFEVGQIFYASWGYDQTNVDFYQLVELRGKTMGRIVPIGAKTVSSNPPQDKVVADPEFVREYDALLDIEREDKNKSKWKRLTKHGFKVGHTYASPWDGNPRYETSCGWGH